MSHDQTVLPDCCDRDNCCEEQIVNIPGSPGTPGTPGAAGTNGVNAFTVLTAGFTMPAEGGDVQITVATTAWMVARQGAIQGQIIYIGFAGHFEVRSVDSATLATVRNLEDSGAGLYPDNAAPATAIPSAARVSPAGLQGPDGTTPAGVLLAVNDLSDVDSVPTARANLGLGSAAVLDAGVGSGDLPPADGALTNGEAVFATATGIESQPASTARTSLGLGTMATQNAGGVAITGGTINGTTIGGVTPAPITGTTLAATGNFTAGSRSFTPASVTQSLLAASAVNPNATKLKVAGSGGAVTLTATPTITAPSSDGQLLLIQGTDGTNTVEFQDEASLAGSGLELGAASRVLGLGDILLLTWDAATSKWYEITFSNN